MTVLMPANNPSFSAPTADVISPAEAQFWLEWAEKAPALLRYVADKQMPDTPQISTPYRMAGVGLGVVLGAVSLTKWVPGKWKWLGGAAALGAAGTGLYIGSLADKMNVAAASAFPAYRQAITQYADAIEQNPQLRQQLANYLAKSVTAEDIQETGIEPAVALRAMNFGKTAPYLNINALKESSRFQR